MRILVTILALAMFAGVSVATLENGDLTNIDASAFDGKMFAKDGQLRFVQIAGMNLPAASLNLPQPLYPITSIFELLF